MLLYVQQSHTGRVESTSKRLHDSAGDIGRTLWVTASLREQIRATVLK